MISKTQTTKVKNTFIDVDEGQSPAAERRRRRNRTEPPSSAGFMNCLAEDEEESDDEQPAAPQPSITYTKTMDPFENPASPSAGSQGGGESPVQAKSSGTSPTDEEQMGKRRTVVKNTFIDVEEEDAQARELKRSATTPGKNRRVAFLCGAADSDDEDEDEDDESQPAGITYEKTYDNFEERPVSQPVPMVSHQESMVTHQSSVGAQPVTVAMASLMQQPQVFTIPVPVGMPLGAHHAIQLPMGLPPGSTVMVIATQMSSTSAPAAAASVATAAPAAAAVGVLSPGSSPRKAVATAGSPSATMMLPAQTISKTTRLDGSLRITYIVDARKLKANDKVIISPPFEISDEHPGQYRVIINPSPIKARGGPTFKNTGGLGNVQLKCEDRTEGAIGFRIFISDGRPNSLRSELSRGPVQHDFANGGVCGLPAKHQEWDFNKVVDNPSKTFSVCLDIQK